MAENQALNAFLEKEGNPPPPEPAQPAAEPPAPTTPPAESKAPARPTEAPAKLPEAKPEDDDDVSPDDTRTVPRAALTNLRTEWKVKYAAEQARAELLAKQLEELKRPRAEPAPPPAPVPIPDFNQDPQGFIQHQAVRNQQVILNERLNMSEYMLREKIGNEAVDQYVKDFQEHAERDPSLWPKLYSQPTPYQWLTKEIDRRRLHSEIGDDVGAYRQKLIAEERAKWEAERAQSQPPAVSPAASLPPSLANARSVAGRGSPAWTGEPSLDDVVRGIPSHVRAQRGRS